MVNGHLPLLIEAIQLVPSFYQPRQELFREATYCCNSYPWHHEASHDEDEEEELLDDEDHRVRVHLRDLKENCYGMLNKAPLYPELGTGQQESEKRILVFENVFSYIFLFGLCIQGVYPDIIKDTEVDVEALVEAVVLTEQVQAKVWIAGGHHHRCRWCHGCLVVQQRCLPRFLVGKSKFCYISIFLR